jgi:hypothetical protein
MAQAIEFHQGRNLLYASIVAPAGTTALVAAPTDNQRIKVCSYVVVADAAGTCKFSDGSDLTGAMSFAENGGVAAAGQASSPWFAADPNAPLSIVTTSDMNGHLSYVVEP